jgi:uncharacterized phage protein gp47/JayE
MADFGVTSDGFVVKPFDVILAESRQRTQQLFGANVDLTPTSPLLKILQVAAAEDAALWQRLENLYYSGFVSTAVGDELDLLGENIGLQRRFVFAEGQVTITVTNPQPQRIYVLPEGTRLVTTGAPAIAYATTEGILLDATTPQRTVGVRAFARGPASDLSAAASLDVDPVYARLYLNLQLPTTLAVGRLGDFVGGAATERDEDYRARLLGFPRSVWTLESVRAAVVEVDGVKDVRLSDPLGGVDVSQSYFKLFDFGRRLFSDERRLGEPYFFDVVVAHESARPWRTQGGVTGIFEQVTTALDRVRPVGIFPNVVEADHIEIGLRAQVLVRAGYDTQALLTAFLSRIRADTGTLGLGGDVLYSQVMRAIVEQPGVLDVQNLHLRRRSTKSDGEIVEAGAGENLPMGPREVAVLQLGSDLSDVELIAQ